MKQFKFTLSTFAVLLTGILGVSAADRTYDMPNAQSAPNNDSVTETSVLILGRVNFSSEDLIKRQAEQYFRSTLRRGPQQVGMPRFLITDNSGKAVFAIGGFVQARGAYDFNGKVNNLDFVTYDIPMTPTPQNRQGLLMDVSTSRIYFKSIVNTRSIGPIETYVETDFRGGNSVLRLREAYVKFAGFTFGQTVSTFTDMEASPNTIDFEGPNAYTYGRNIMIRFEQQLGRGWSMAVAAEMPVLSGTYCALTEAVPQRIPDIPLYFQYAWNDQSHIRASGIFRTLNYYDLAAHKDRHQFGWGAQLSGTARLTRGFHLYGQALYGEGIGQYVQDLQGNGFDLVRSLKYPGELSTPSVFAWFAGAQVNLTKKLPITIGYSQVHVYTDNNNAFSPNSYKLSQYIVANAFYNISRSFSVGLEYLYGTRYDMNGEFGRSSRAQAMVQFNF